MKHICLYEGFPSVFNDPIYANDIFKIRFRQVNDLGNKRAPDTIPKPEDDLLDEFQIGDVIIGQDENEDFHQGKIVKIERDEEGNGTKVVIEEDGELIPLSVTSIKLKDKVGNHDPGTYVPGKQLLDIDTTQGPEFFGGTYEGRTLKNIKRFSDL